MQPPVEDSCTRRRFLCIRGGVYCAGWVEGQPPQALAAWGAVSLDPQQEPAFSEAPSVAGQADSEVLSQSDV